MKNMCVNIRLNSLTLKRLKEFRVMNNVSQSEEVRELKKGVFKSK